MEEITGIPAETIVGRGQEEYSIPFYGKKRPMLINFVLNRSLDPDVYYQDVRRDGDCISTEGHISRNDQDIYVLASANPLFNSHGKLIGAIETLRDISLSKMAEMNLIRTNEKLHLLSSITRHDIRNRLTVLRSLLPMIKPENADPEIREYYELIERATIAISDQIEFTRDYQEMGIHAPEWWDTGELIDKISSSGDMGNISIDNHIFGVRVYADPLLERVFYNLIDNAIRHGRTVTRISFSWTLDDNRLIIHCEDNGIGIEDQDKERVFDRGYGSNTGLGLFLVREILSITRISIKETGLYGSGARFEISVPFRSYTLPEVKKA